MTNSEEKSKKEIFKDSNLRRKMEKLFRFLNPPKSFTELKEKSQEFQKNLENEQEKRKLKSKPTSDSCGYK